MKDYAQSFYCRRFILAFFAIVISWFSMLDTAVAASITLAWKPSASSAVVGYKVFYGTQSGNYTSQYDVGNNIRRPIPNLTDGVTYYFAVKAYDINGNESDFSNEVKATVSTTPALSADFTADKTGGTHPLTVRFTPKTTGIVTGWLWHFSDDGSIPDSRNQFATVSYTKAGTYNVSLKVNGPGGNVTHTKTAFIVVTDLPQVKPTANFRAAPRIGFSPLPVSFSDASTGTVSSWLWNFGDGTSSTSKTPKHVYNKPGLYPVTLTVNGALGSSQKSFAGYVTVLSPLAAYNTGLVAAYNFDEFSKTIVVDNSGKGNHATLLNGARRVTVGQSGKSVFFDGINDHIVVPDHASLDLTKGFTLLAWVKPASSGINPVISKELAVAPVYGLFASDANGLPYSTFNNGSFNNPVFGKSNLANGTWTHVASSYSGSLHRLYVNGIKVGEEAYSGNIRISNGNLTIGGSPLLSQYLRGEIDEVRIYERALTPAQIAESRSVPIRMTNPGQRLLGHAVVTGAIIETKSQGAAVATRASVRKSGILTAIALFTDKTNSTSELTVGIYSDKSGTPGTLLSQNTITSPITAGTWVRVPIPPVQVLANRTYWVAVLGSAGAVKMRKKTALPGALTENFATFGLKTLPANWISGERYPDNTGLLVHGIGYLNH